MWRRRRILLAAARARATDGPLAALDPLDRGEMRWTQPSWKQARWRLEWSGRMVATLERAHWFGPDMTLRLADRLIAIRRNVWGPARVVVDGAAEPLLRYKPGFFLSGTIVTARGETLHLARVGCFRFTAEIRTADGLTLATLTPRREFMHHGAGITLEDAARRRDDLVPLLALAWTVMLQHHHKGH